VFPNRLILFWLQNRQSQIVMAKTMMGCSSYHFSLLNLIVISCFDAICRWSSRNPDSNISSEDSISLFASVFHFRLWLGWLSKVHDILLGGQKRLGVFFFIKRKKIFKKSKPKMTGMHVGTWWKMQTHTFKIDLIFFMNNVLLQKEKKNLAAVCYVFLDRNRRRKVILF